MNSSTQPQSNDATRSLASGPASVSQRQAERFAPQLTRYLNVAALQDIQDGFAAVTGLEAQIVDTDNRPITEPTVIDERVREREDALRMTLDADAGGPLKERFDVPIVVGDRRLGSIVLTGRRLIETEAGNAERFAQLAERFGIGEQHREAFCESVDAFVTGREGEAVRFVYLLADVIAEVCRQDIAVRQRADELDTLYRLGVLLAGQRDLDHVLKLVASSVVEVMNVKAASIRLLSEDGDKLVPAAVHGLSKRYMDKGMISLHESLIDLASLDGEVVYVEDMATDTRVLFPDDARREGLGSILSAGMTYRGQRVGVMRIYSHETRQFSGHERNLLQTLAQTAGAAIQNVRLAEERRAARRVQRQVTLAGQVQRRLMPDGELVRYPFAVAGHYEPCFELGGDFFDYIPLENSIGLIVGDVVGKGVPASLLMASVRAAIRAHAEDTYDLDSVMEKVNRGLSRDTLDNEFATVFYATLDTQTRRMTYCSAGHDPALLLRDGEFIPLDQGGIVLGVDHAAEFEKGVIDLRQDDVLLIYSDGLPDAMNFQQEKFGKQRVMDAVRAMADGSARMIMKHVLWELRRFVGLNNQSDDVTLLVVKMDEGFDASI